MKLAIFGPTGGTGQRLVEAALAADHEVTAFARNPRKLTPRHNLTILQGDVFDAGRVEEAVAGKEAVISVLGGEPSNPLRPAQPQGPGSTGAENIIAAMEEHGVRRLVCQTAWGVGESEINADPGGTLFMKVLVPLFLKDDYADKEREERIVRTSEVEWVIVRPTILTNGNRTGRYRAGVDLSPGKRPWIPRSDVADFLLAQLTDDTFLYRTPAISH
jgi:putative NADH-flavin reductase